MGLELQQGPRHECARSQGLQHGAGDLRQAALLAQPEPDQRGTFERECARGRARAQRERHGQRGKADGEHREGIAEQALARALPPGQQQVQRGRGQCDQGQRHALALQQRRLQREREQRVAEHERAIDEIALRGAAPCAVQDRHGKVDREEREQERLGAGQQRPLVAQHAPRGADREREQEAEQVQHAPRLVSGNGQDREVEHEVIGEQRNVVAAAGRDEDRCGEAGQQPKHGKRERVLQHGQHAGAGDQHDQQRERRAGRQQWIEAECGEYREQQDADRAALQRQRERTARVAHAPAECEGRHRGRGDAAQTQFDRYAQPALVGGVLEQGRDAGEQHEHADLDRYVALAEPAADRAAGAVEPIRLAPAHGRCCDGGGDRCRHRQRRRGWPRCSRRQWWQWWQWWRRRDDGRRVAGRRWWRRCDRRRGTGGRCRRCRCRSGIGHGCGCRIGASAQSTRGGAAQRVQFALQCVQALAQRAQPHVGDADREATKEAECEVGVIAARANDEARDAGTEDDQKSHCTVLRRQGRGQACILCGSIVP